MKRLFLFLVLTPSLLRAEAPKQFPNISGNAMFQVQVDRVISTNANQVPDNNGFVYAEPNFSLNFDRNWSAKTQWRLQPNNILTTRNTTYPERYRNFLQSDRSLINTGETALFVEELKVNYENDDLRAFVGKFDPTFGTAWRKSKRIGVFAAQFNEDYNLREKLGAGVTALLEGSQITFNTFFNDRTGLSNSVIYDRGQAGGGPGIAGNTNFSSYSFSMEGKNFIGVENWFYNFGYRSLGVSKIQNRARETGIVIGSEYLYKISRDSSLIPLVELVSINNFTGEKKRDAHYTTIALIGKYSSWTASTSFVSRIISQNQRANSRMNDRQIQFSIGYKFTDNLTIDISRANVREDGKNGALIGTTISYFYKF
ncbi:MAG: hypothetical protein FJX34_05475 [Alphaproteobacteria bacterium]|nr:hypothetical protein [Alphaproteobacteria bacterium]